MYPSLVIRVKSPNRYSAEVLRPILFVSDLKLFLASRFVQIIYGDVKPVEAPRQRSDRPVARLIPNPKLKLADQCREVMRFKHLAFRTEKTYLEWIERFVRFHRREAGADSKESGPTGGWRHPRDMGANEVGQFLSHLASERAVAASTQNQALNALVFLYREVLGKDLEEFGDFERARRTRRLPVVLTKAETLRLLTAVPDNYRLFFQLLYGTGLRLMEGLRLRVKDVDFGAGHMVVRDGKGFKPDPFR